MTYFNQNRKDFYWLNEQSSVFLERGYLLEGTTPLQRIKDIQDVILKRSGDINFANEWFEYMAKGFYSLASPIWQNFGLDRGLPISCFGGVVPDSIFGLSYTISEVATMSQAGGGTSGYFGKLRPRGSKITNNGESNGSFSFLPWFDKTIDVVAQGTSRKGQFAAYLDIEHPDVEEWLNIQTEGNPVQLMFYGICVGNDWIKEMEEGDKKKRQLWAKVLQRRKETGIPYLFFKDNANNNKPEIYKALNSVIHASNLCSEISLPSTEEESFVCCLSSMNLERYDDWKGTNAVEVLVKFLDIVMSEFITKAEFYTDAQTGINFLQRAINFAKRHRALGLGVLGWHSLLQSKMIPFDSPEAMFLNAEIWRTIKERSYKASEKLGEEYGCAPIFYETETSDKKRRNATLMSVAPTKSSSFILGQVSPSVEPYKSNYFVKDLAKSKTTFKNPYLLEVLKSKEKNTPDIWESILLNNGSVQHLSCLDDHEKNVFRTFSEISQLSIIQQAAQRQQFIDQGQSINLMLHPNTPVKDINFLHLTAVKLGLKSLYYQFSMNAAQELNRSLLECASCEG